MHLDSTSDWARYMDARRPERNGHSTEHAARTGDNLHAAATMLADAAGTDRTAGSSHKPFVSLDPLARPDVAGPAPMLATQLDVRPQLVRALSGGVGLLAQPRSASLARPTLPTVQEPSPPPPSAHSDSSTPSEGHARPSTTSSGSHNYALDPGVTSFAEPSLLFSSDAHSSDINIQAPVPTLLLNAPSPAPHIARTSPPPSSEPQPVRSPLLSAPSLEITSPRTPPNLRLEIPLPGNAQEGALPSARDPLRAPFAPDIENEGICTEVGSLGQEIQLESGDHLNALERIYLYTQSKATFHRIFMSRALPTYLNEVTPVEAVEYVLPLLGGLAIDEEERVKETFVGELLVIIWWFFTTCRLTDQEPEPAVEPEPGAEPGPPPFVSVQSFSAVLASLLLSSNPAVSATARGTVVELLGRARWVAKQAEEGNASESGVQRKQFCETMRPVEPWEQGLLGPEEARMIQLEIIYGVIIDLGRLDLNGDEMAGVEGEGEGGVEGAAGEGEYVAAAGGEGQGEGGADETLYDLDLNATQEDLSTLDDQSGFQGPQNESNSDEHRSLASPYSKSPSASLSDSALTPTLASSKSYSPYLSPSASDPTLSSGFTTPRYIPATPFPASVPAAGSVPFDASSVRTIPTPTSASTIDSSSSLNLPELSPADSSRSSIASPAEPASPPEGTGADYVSTRNSGADYGSRSSGVDYVSSQNGTTGNSGDYGPSESSRGDYGSTSNSRDAEPNDSLTVPSLKSSANSSPRTDELSWHTPNGSGSESDAFHSFLGRAGAGASLSPPKYVRPGFQRRESAMSLGTSSEINPDDYADAEEWVDEGEYRTSAYREDGVETEMGEGEEGADTEMGAGEDEDGVATEVGEAPMDVEGEGEGAEDAYIDDGAAAEEAAIGRVASMSLVAAVTSSGVVDDEIFTLFVDEVMRVSADPVYWVRSETSYALGTLAKAVGDEVVEPYLLPILEALMTDTEAHVRQSSVFAIPPVLKRLTPQRRREIAFRYMLNLCEDTADTVRTGALQVLAEVIHTFQEDKDGPPQELLSFFLKGENEQTEAPLPNPEAERLAAEAEDEKDPYSEWNVQPRTSWSEPSSYFQTEPTFPDPDRALICAFNFPAVALTLGPTGWSRLSGYYGYLARESWHTPKVRSTLAASAGEIARIVGAKAARTDVVPVWWTCVSGDQREAKIKALNSLPALLGALDEGGRAEVAGRMAEAWEKHVGGWKEREAFARQLGAVVPMLKSEGAVLRRIFKSGLEDRVAAIREAVIAAVPVLHDALQGNDAHIRVARDDLFELGASGTYRHRTTFLACCRVLIESPLGSSILNDSRFSSHVAPLATHSVIDVRIGLGRLLTSICEHHMPTRNQRPDWLSQCLETLDSDTSSDVQSYVHRAVHANFVVPRPPKVDDRPASPEFAEFSCPP